MAQFVELEDGSWINLDHAVRIHPLTRSNRIDFVTGVHMQLTDADAEKIRKQLALKPVSEAFSVGTDGEAKYEQVISREEIQKLENEAFNGSSASEAEAKPKKRRGRPPKKTKVED